LYLPGEWHRKNEFVYLMKIVPPFV